MCASTPRRPAARRKAPSSSGASSSAKRSRPRSSAPLPAGATCSRGCRVAAGTALFCSSTTSTSSRRMRPYWKEAAPFEGKINHGFLYGRGVYDMKSLGLAQALAMARLKRKGIVPETDILFLGRSRRGARTEVGRPLASGEPAGLVRGRRPGPQRGRHDRGDPAGTGLLGDRDPAGGLRARRSSRPTTEARLKSLRPRMPKIPAPPVEPHPHVVMGFDMLANRLASAADRPAAPSRPGPQRSRGARDPAQPLRELPRAARGLVARSTATRRSTDRAAHARRDLGASGRVARSDFLQPILRGRPARTGLRS